MVNVGDKVRVARDESPDYWIGAEGVVESIKEERGLSNPVARVLLTTPAALADEAEATTVAERPLSAIQRRALMWGATYGKGTGSPFRLSTWHSLADRGLITLAPFSVTDAGREVEPPATLELIEEKINPVAINDEAIRLASEFLGLPTDKVFQVLDLAVGMTLFKEERQ